MTADTKATETSSLLANPLTPPTTPITTGRRKSSFADFVSSVESLSTPENLEIAKLALQEFHFRQKIAALKMQQDFLLIEQEFLENLLKPTVKNVLRSEFKSTESLKDKLSYEIRKLAPDWQKRLMPNHPKFKAAFSHRFVNDHKETKDDKATSHFDDTAYSTAITKLLGEEGSNVLTAYVGEEHELSVTADNLKKIKTLKNQRNYLLIREYFFESILLPLLKQRKEAKSDLPTLPIAINEAVEKRLKLTWGIQVKQEEKNISLFSSTPKKPFSIPNCHLSIIEQIKAINTLKDGYNSSTNALTNDEALQQATAEYNRIKSAIRECTAEILELQKKSATLEKIKQRFEASFTERAQLASKVGKYGHYHSAIAKQLSEKTANTQLAFLQDNDVTSFEKLKTVISKNMDINPLLSEPISPNPSSENTQGFDAQEEVDTIRQKLQASIFESIAQFTSKNRYKLLGTLSIILTVINTLLLFTGVLAPIGIILEFFNQIALGNYMAMIAVSYVAALSAPWLSYGLTKVFSAIADGIERFLSATVSCFKVVIAYFKEDAVAELQAHTDDSQGSLSYITSIVENPDRGSISNLETRTPSSSVTDDRQRGSSAPPPAPMIQTEGPSIPSSSTSIPASEGTTSRSTTADLLGNRFIPNADPVPGNTALGKDLLSSTPALPTSMNSPEQSTPPSQPPGQSVVKTQTQAEEVTLAM